jgi:hypothetical protein
MVLPKANLKESPDQPRRLTGAFSTLSAGLRAYRLAAGGEAGAGTCAGMAGFVPVESGLRLTAPEPVVSAGVVTAGRSVRARVVSPRFNIA